MGSYMLIKDVAHGPLAQMLGPGGGSRSYTPHAMLPGRRHNFLGPGLGFGSVAGGDPVRPEGLPGLHGLPSQPSYREWEKGSELDRAHVPTAITHQRTGSTRAAVSIKETRKFSYTTSRGLDIAFHRRFGGVKWPFAAILLGRRPQWGGPRQRTDPQPRLDQPANFLGKVDGTPW